MTTPAEEWARKQWAAFSRTLYEDAEMTEVVARHQAFREYLINEELRLAKQMLLDLAEDLKQ